MFKQKGHHDTGHQNTNKKAKRESPLTEISRNKQHWDAFVSYAWEDKETFVRPLVQALGRLGVSLWYDEVSLKLGDSLSGSIDRGIAKSRYGIVVVSPAFLEKNWPEAELRALISPLIKSAPSDSLAP